MNEVVAAGVTVRLTVAQAVVRWLQAQYSERDGEVQRAVPAIFGIFGHGNVLGLGQAIAQDGADLPLYQPKNEQAMVHAAAGYAKASRRLATLACTASIGPGATNMVTGAATATVDRLPVLLFPSDTFAGRRQGTVLQQMEHPVEADATVNDLFRPVSRFFDRISRPEQLLTALPQAMRVLLDPAETGAVTVSLHQDVQGEAWDFPAAFFERKVWPVTRRPPAPSELDAVAELLGVARSPLLIAGGGVRYSAAEAELRKFVTELGIPVGETSAGKGSLTDSELLLGGIGVNGTAATNRFASAADLVLCAGTRLTDFTTASRSLFQHPDVRFVGLNVNGADACKMGATAIVADLRETLKELRDRLTGSVNFDLGGSARQATEEWKERIDADIAPCEGQLLGQGEVLRTLNEAARPGDWLVTGAGWQPGDLLKLWEVPTGSFTHIEFGNSCMGHEIPAGIGIRMREGGDGEVFVVIGDGTYLMNPTELVTAVQEDLKVTVVLLDNGGYQSIARLARSITGESYGNDFLRRGESRRFPDGERVKVDFVANAASMGCAARLANTSAELAAALREAREGTRSNVIVCPTERGRSLLAGGAFWDLGVPQESTEAQTNEASLAHRREAERLQRPYL
ncbi:MAG: 3D-(3,5/4)-trihydroxycyclohexane-1,2-dione acylhydrolase (decyclizing) [Actinobacteria bacterium]|nr:3D-(3,5/4)-trihydroxycyclohexane-1,2-dione acylhydrolase (decyclizing) [Actinomycetota bacterium]